MKTIRAFLLGASEFRLSFTTRLPDGLMGAYDHGRDFMHAITFRRYED